MTRQEFENEIAYYFTKSMLKDLKSKSILSQAEYELVLKNIKAKYEPYFDLLSD